MMQFAKYISETYGISEPLARTLCDCFVKGDTPFYCSEYIPAVAAEMEGDQVWEIFDFLHEMERLTPKKKRLISILQKDGKLTGALQQRIEVCVSSFELDDLLLPLRPNPRSKAQLALKKGLGDLATHIAAQADSDPPLDELIAPLIVASANLSTAAEVLAGVKDILAERFAYDETGRTMTRDFVLEDGYFEITPRQKNDDLFSQYSGKQLPIAQCSREQILSFLAADEQKRIRCKINVQLFRITELLRHHWITNPNAGGFDLICEAIDESWLRLLQPIVERDVKERLRTECTHWAYKTMAADLRLQQQQKSEMGTILVTSMFDNSTLVMVASNSEGRLLGAASEKITPAKSAPGSDRLRQFLTRHHPSAVIVLDNSQSNEIESLLAGLLGGDIALSRHSLCAADTALSASTWMTQQYASCDDNMRLLFSIGLRQLLPLQIISQVGVAFFTIHPLQTLLSGEQTTAALQRMIGLASLQRGILPADFFTALEQWFPSLSKECLEKYPSRTLSFAFTAKDTALSIEGMTETLFRNIAGFVVIPDARNPFDRTLMHPDHFEWISSLALECQVAGDALIQNPEILRSCTLEDYTYKLFIEKKVLNQLRIGQRFNSVRSFDSRRKIKLTDLAEGGLVGGTVTNITPFGVFVNINAVCDGLIHISQLADGYIEHPDQVVSLGDEVSVRILKVDPKKRRISLSMKGLAQKGIKIKPSQNQLSTLADHFKNR